MSATFTVAITVRLSDINYSLSLEQKDFSNYNKSKSVQESRALATLCSRVSSFTSTHVDSMSSGSVSSELTEPVNKHL